MTTSHYQAARENLFGHVPFLQRRMPGMLIRDLGGALLVDSGLGSDTFNKVLWECGGDAAHLEYNHNNYKYQQEWHL